jgi:ketosteroid isomerase-like protein
MATSWTRVPSTHGKLPSRIFRSVTTSNADVVRQLFERFETGGVDAVIEGAAEDVLIEIPPELSAEPDVYRGHEGVRRYFGGFDGMIDDVRYEAIEIEPVGELVLAHTRLSGRGATSGLAVEIEVFVLHELADGRIVRIRPYPDMESARAAAERAA